MKAIFIKDCYDINPIIISSSLFIDNFSYQKGIILIISPVVLYIKNCTFVNNIAREGTIYLDLKGMIYLKPALIMDIKISDCYFYNNSAEYGSALYIIDITSNFY